MSVILYEHGRFYEPVYCPVEVRGEEKRCFRNSRQLALLSEGELIYCEGFAYTEAHPFALPHAWCANAAGEVVEVTWPHLGLVYFGAPFAFEYIRQWENTDDDERLLAQSNIERLPTFWKHSEKS